MIWKMQFKKEAWENHVKITDFDFKKINDAVSTFTVGRFVMIKQLENTIDNAFSVYRLHACMVFNLSPKITDHARK